MRACRSQARHWAATIHRLLNSLGNPKVAIIVRHVIPNMASLLGTSFTGATNYALGAAVGLEFLGFGDLHR